ncbi:MAG TPA: lipid-binding protein [Flavobacterium sp.]|uniref:lipid-binding protein n=1 Tax=Flavobacterium sp. TaxID=239 RepID=UPI002DBB0C14|nr:lipid-binding protein [Flavobacterium sp.]HEU4788363.1 lipid-binding protein [Flavobacterium sp.]
MNILKEKVTKVFLTIFLLTLIISCDEGGNPEGGGTTTQNFAGDWHIIALESDGVTPVTNYLLYTTYNASSNDENFWIDDHDPNAGFGLKTKVQAKDFNTLTFSGKPNSEQIYPTRTVFLRDPTVTITNGKILKNAAHSFAGHVVDSIYFEAEFPSEPGIIYKFAGHKRTGFLEDEL